MHIIPFTLHILTLTHTHSFSLFYYQILVICVQYTYKILKYITIERVESQYDDTMKSREWVSACVYRSVCISIYSFSFNSFSHPSIHAFIQLFIHSLIVVVFFRGDITPTIYRHRANNSFKSVTGCYILQRNLPQKDNMNEYEEWCKHFSNRLSVERDEMIEINNWLCSAQREAKCMETDGWKCTL